MIVYKLDRLTRSLIDSARLAEFLDRCGVQICSVTQAMDLESSIGKLTHNMLVSIAQYERKRLVVNKREAKLVRRIFERYLALGAATEIAAELNAEGHRTKSWTTKSGKEKGGIPWHKGHVHLLLTNRVYIGQIAHKDEFFDGQHTAIVDQDLWDRVQAHLAENHRARGNNVRRKSEALLKGLIRCGHCDCAMSPTFTNRRGKTYRYYSCQKTNKVGPDACPVGTVPAGVIESAVIDELRAVFRTPEIVAQTIREVRSREGEEAPECSALASQPLSDNDIVAALKQIEPLWETLFPAERARIVQLLVARLDVAPDGLDLRLRVGGLRSLVAEMGVSPETRKVG